jgi:hypothetical protein
MSTPRCHVNWDWRANRWRYTINFPIFYEGELSTLPPWPGNLIPLDGTKGKCSSMAELRKKVSAELQIPEDEICIEVPC